MASQINPVIAAFLQSREQANDVARSLIQQQLMQQRIQQDQEQNELLNQYRVGQLQLGAFKAQQEAQEADKANKLRQLQAQISGLGEARQSLDKNILSTSGASGLIKSLGFEPERENEIITGLINYAARQQQEAQAKAEQAKALIQPEVEKTQALAGPEAEAAALKAGKVAEAELPYKEEYVATQHQYDKDMQEIVSKDRYDLEKLRQNRADARAAGRNAINKQLGISSSVVTRLATTHDSHPIARDMASRLASYNAIKTLNLNTKNPGDDISAITQFAKIIDPSVVRPSEYETVRHYFQSLPDNIQAQIKRTINSGGTTFLTPQARQGLKDAAGNLMRGQVAVYLPYRKSITDRIDDLTQSKVGEDYVGTGFFPEEVEKVGNQYLWVDRKSKKVIPLYGGK